MSDGEFQEGQTWEALQTAAFHQLSNLRVIVDVNQAQCDGPMESVMSIEPLADRVRAFGWSASVVDGHDLLAITQACLLNNGHPHIVLCYTDAVRGLPILNERRPFLHYLRFKHADEREKYELAYREMENR